MDKSALIEHLLQYVTENKREKMQAVLANRTRYITVVLEDLFQEHNASAALRTCDIFGIQDVHVVEAKYTFKAIPTIAMGSSKWVDVHPYRSITDAITELKKEGYRIVATTPHTDCYTLPSLPLDQKTALIFGSEQTGLSQEALAHADTFVKIPMYGFVESFNVSVSVALCLYDVITRLHQSTYAWQLSEEEKQDIMLAWIRKVSATAASLCLSKLD
ncbi:MAG TPA: RNA methyltransferase [Candidatus Babeliales bacterium]|jgi:tRNA (guanosine-2'-O-)-methyltransferase|nr:RNA methyltransferase [Candidatus Babeliales bacterium]